MKKYNLSTIELIAGGLVIVKGIYLYAYNKGHKKGYEKGYDTCTNLVKFAFRIAESVNDEEESE